MTLAHHVTTPGSATGAWFEPALAAKDSVGLSTPHMRADGIS
jgi:hypothetical protein